MNVKARNSAQQDPTVVSAGDFVPSTARSWRFRCLGWTAMAGKRARERLLVFGLPGPGGAVWCVRPPEISLDVLMALDGDVSRWRQWFPRRGWHCSNIDRLAAVSYLVAECLAAGELSQADVERLEREWRPRSRQQAASG
jgi:hypothetical protein